MPTITVNLLFLAFPYTDSSGDPHPDAVAYLQGISMDNTPGQGGAGADWHIYRDAAHFASGAAPVGQIHDNTPTAEYFPAIFQPVITGSSRATDTALAFANLALSHKTVPVLNADGTTQVDPATNLPVMKSQFDGATIVTLPVPITVPG